MSSRQPPLLGQGEGFFDLHDLQSNADAFDDDVAASPQIDQFCASSCWILPAAQELMPPRQAAIRKGPEGWLAFMRGEHSGSGRYLEPLEASWGLACPLIGPDPVALVSWLEAVLSRCRDDWDLTLLAGLPANSQLLLSVAAVLGKRFRLLRHGRAGRHVASLEGGFDGFLSRRSSNFRRNLTRAQSRARAAGVHFEHHKPTTATDALAMFQRVQRLETKSWKGRDDVGIARGPFGDFYRNMVPRLAKRGALHVVFARQGEQDVAFMLGGAFGDTIRGLQVSFRDDLRALSLGNLCQAHLIATLAGEASRYDLGSTGLTYKLRWAETITDNEILLVLPR